MSKARKDGGVQPPIDLCGFFQSNDDSEDEVVDDDRKGFENEGENQLLTIGGIKLTIRQYSWHQTNANQVWPGTFALADFIHCRADRYKTGKMIELGSATGALAIYLKMLGGYDIVTRGNGISDIDDNGEVSSNILFNTKQNGLEPMDHIAHTWGTGWPRYLAQSEPLKDFNISSQLATKFIIASDILLYVSAYPSLVKSLLEIFASEGLHDSKEKRGVMLEFLMAWNRRISASSTFFDLMRDAGFRCHHHGQCIYSFYKIEEETVCRASNDNIIHRELDPYLMDLKYT